MGKNKKDNSLLPLLAVGGALLLMGGSSKKSKSGGNTINQQLQTGNDTSETDNDAGGLLEDLKDNQFEVNNGVSSPTSQDIIPYIVPSSFVVKKTPEKYYYFERPDSTNYDYEVKRYTSIARISFLICIQVPETSLGSLKIEDVFFDDIQIVRYINDLQQKWYSVGEYQLEKLANQFKGKYVYTGNNLFEISFEIGGVSDLYMQDYSYEAISIGFNIKYEETRIAHWRMLSAWNIKEDTLTNEGVYLGTNTRFGIVRDANSKPRDQRGLFSEWWNIYVQNGYNTNITQISSGYPDYYLGYKD